MQWLSLVHLEISSSNTLAGPDEDYFQNFSFYWIQTQNKEQTKCQAELFTLKHMEAAA